MSGRTDNQPGVETIATVSAALAFVAQSFMALAEDGEMSKQAMLGAAHIIDMCNDALREADAGNEADQ